jgi:predicted dehydrogenase
MFDSWNTTVDGLRRNRRIVPREMPIGTAVVGCGYWGPNLARNLAERSEFQLQALCDRDPARLGPLAGRYPDALALGDLEEVLCDDSIEAVVVATPPKTHHAIVKQVLEAGKHVLVEKPLATRLSDAQELADIAEDSELVLMPGHTFIYSPAVNAVRDLIQDGTVGDIHFVTSARMNLGKYQSDGVVCDLAPHDLSILLYWLDQPVVGIAASGSSVFKQDVPETAFLTLTFAGGSTANVQISWLAPCKVRQMIVAGSKRMIQYDDTASDEPIRVYDRGIDEGPPPANFGEHQLIYRTGDVISPRVQPQEPLSLELQDFARSIRTGSEPRSNVALGLDIVALVELAGESMRANGMPLAMAPRLERAAAAA